MEKQTSQFVKKLAKNARSQYSKAKRTYTCRSLKEVIKAYRACTTSAEERALVKKESAHIRDLFKEGDSAFRRRNIAKLLFFHMNGYDTNFGMTECVKLCASDKFSDKRVAYLGLMILVDETEAILMLITNSLKRDLNSSDQHTVGLALTVLADLASADMARDLLPEIEKLLDSPNPYLRRKAALASVRVVRKLPSDETPNLLASVPRLFESRQSGAHVAGTALVVSLARQSPTNLQQLRATTFPAMLAVLRDLLLSPNRSNSANSNVISGVRNPFMQVKVLQALRIVGQGAPREAIESISDVLAHVASNTDSSKIIGTAVLYECVRTIVALNTEPSLRTLAVSTLGRFLSHKDPNVRHVALQELVKVVSHGRSDASMEEYRRTITDCLDEPDPTIKHRALELLHAIATPANATEIADRLALFLGKVDDKELKESACRKLCDLIDRFAPSTEWRCDMFLRALQEVDLVMPQSLLAAFIAWVSTDSSIGAYAAKLVYERCLSQVGIDHAGGKTGSSTAVSTVADPFENLAVVAVPASAKPEGGNEKSMSPTKALSRRRPRFERVSVSLFAEYGDTIIDVAGGGGGGVSVDDAVSCIEKVLDVSSVGVSSFSSSGLPQDAREDAFGREVVLVREAAMAALAKLAARLTFMSSGGPTPVSLGASVAAAAALGSSGTQALGIEGPQGLLALTNGSRGASPARAPLSSSPDNASGALALTQPKGGGDAGLGTDLLASLGIGDSPPATSAPVSGTSALVSAPQPRDDQVGLLDASGDSLMLGADDVGVHPVLLRARRIFARYRQSLDLETQQRACEYSCLLTGNMASLRAVAFSRLPPMDYAAMRERMAKANAAYKVDADEPGVQAPFSEDLLLLLEEDNDSPANAANSIAGPADLLSLPSSERTEAPAPASSGVGSSTLEDLLGGGAVAETASSTKGADSELKGTGLDVPQASVADSSFGENGTSKSTEATDVALGSANVLSTETMSVLCNFFKDAGSPPGEYRAEFLYSNLSDGAYSKFVFQLAVPKYMQTDMRPASSGSIPGGGVATQVVILRNSMHGSKPVQLRYRVQYSTEGGEVVREQGALLATDLPSGLS